MILSGILALAIAHGYPNDLGPAWTKTSHEIAISGHEVNYNAVEGFIPITDAAGKPAAKIYFTAYDLIGGSNRPITFAWNGGPGGSSLLLHMYCAGPRSIVQDPERGSSAFRVVDNPDTLLPQTDLVFIDPVGTGFSRTESSNDHSFYGIKGDADSMAQFVEKYLESAHRESSPVFLMGESYGTFRNAAVAHELLKGKTNLVGIVSLSNAIRVDSIVGSSDEDLLFELFLPSYTAVAAYYHKLKPEWNGHPREAIAEAEKFADGEYLAALAQGDALSTADMKRISAKLAEFTGLAEGVIEDHRARIAPDVFRGQLLADQHKVLGGYSATEESSFDPTPKGAVACYSNYLKNELSFSQPYDYVPLSFEANGQWEWGRALEGYPDESADLRAILLRRPQLRIFVAQGMYDMTTSFSGALYSYRHLGLPEKTKKAWEFHLYEGGHMMYLVKKTRATLHADLAGFYANVLNGHN